MESTNRFTDSVRFEYDVEIDFWKLWEEQKIPLPEALLYPVNVRPDEANFEMSAVVGDPAAGIKPFYLSTTEVTADMFYPWATGVGLGEKEWVNWALLGLRPSQMNADTLGYGPPDRPAMGMSRTVAEHYCAWLSRQTGRAYRLPTEAEWEHALRLGGGVPKDRAELLKQATLHTNVNVLDEPPFLEVPTPVGKRQANAIGLYDMLGNAAEWVTDTGEKRVVRGGHLLVKAEELKEDWRVVEDIEAWNATYPQRPIARLWYRDFPYTGIRLACDADQAPITPKTLETPAP